MFQQIKLNYDFDAFKELIDPLTMETHYTKHHATYTKNFNDAVAKLGSTNSPEEILIHAKTIEDKALQTAIINNGGGYYNHNLYFDLMTPHGQKAPTGKLKEKIDATFTSLDNFLSELAAASVGQFGSGWGWLTTDTKGNLSISTTGNQSNPLIETSGNEKPLIAVDVWEHAYYLKYKNLRADYVKAYLTLLDWEKIDALYASHS